MKNFVLCLPILLATSLSFAGPRLLAFEKNDIESLKTQTLGQAFCADPHSYNIQQACKELAAQPELFNWTVSKIQIDTDGSLNVSDGAVRLKILRTDEITVFEINRKEIDLNDYDNLQQLSEAISKMLPKFSKFSWLVNAAFAETVSPTRAITAAALIMRAAADKRVCETANRYLQKCLSVRSIGNEYVELRKKKVNHTPYEVLKEALGKKLNESDREHTQEQIRLFSKTLELDAKILSMLKNKKEVLKSCPSVQPSLLATKRSAMDDVSDCNKIVTDAQAEIKNLPPEDVPSFKEAMTELTKGIQFQELKKAFGTNNVKSGNR